MTLRFHSKIRWKTAAAFLVSALLLFALTNPFQKKKSAWDFYGQMVKGYEMIQGVEMSELKGKLEAVVRERNDCYESFPQLSSRLKICRKQYLSSILALARKNIKSSPSLGKFMLCIRECPLANAMCRGAELNKSDSGANTDLGCSLKEVQCIESCLDRYWRGTE